MERVPGVFRTGRQVEQGELDGPWWDPALDVDTEEEFQNTAVFLCFVPVLRAESLNSTGMDLSPLRSLPCRVQPRSCSARVHARASCSLAPPTGRERAAISEVVEQWNAQIGSALGALVHLVRWETHSVPDVAAPPQEVLNRQIVDKSDFGSRCSGDVSEVQRVPSKRSIDFVLELARLFIPGVGLEVLQEPTRH